MLALGTALGSRVQPTLLLRRDTPLWSQAEGWRRKALDGEDEWALARWFRQMGFDLIHLHAGIGWEGHGIARAAAAAGIPLVRTEHLPFLLTDEGNRAAYRDGTQSVALTIAVSDAVAQTHRDSGCCAGEIVTVRNGIADPSPTGQSFARFERRADRPLLLAIGRLAPQKALHLVLEGVALLAAGGRAVDLMIVGDGPERASLQAQVRQLGLAGSVRFAGGRHDTAALIAEADLLVHSALFEGLPLVLLEAMAAGLPIAACPAPGVDETLDTRTAFLADARTPEALACAIAQALDQPDEARRRADLARWHRAEQFTAARMAHETHAAYRRIARKDTPMTSTRIGFIGAGGIAHRHLGVLRSMEDVAIVAVTDPDGERAQGFADEVGAAVHPDAAAMIAAGDLDAVFICVPPFAHGEPERLAIAANLPFFVEKPVAIDLATAEAIGAEVEAAGLVTGVGYHWRWLDGLDHARAAMDGRRPRLVSGYWLDSTPPPRWWWRQDQSGGQMVEQATHIIDCARYLVGDIEQVFGLAEHTARPEFAELDVPTASTASVRFADGAIGNFAATCLLGWNHRVGLHLFGEGFAIELTDHDVMIDVGQGRPVIGNGRDPVWEQDRAFIDAVRGGENRIRCTYADAMETMRVVDAVLRSATEGRAITLPVPASNPAMSSLEKAA